MKKIPNFDVSVSNGEISLIFQTKEHKCVMKFFNESFVIEIDGVNVFETSK